jgi:hypothetical protein
MAVILNIKAPPFYWDIDDFIYYLYLAWNFLVSKWNNNDYIFVMLVMCIERTVHEIYSGFHSELNTSRERKQAGHHLICFHIYAIWLKDYRCLTFYLPHEILILNPSKSHLWLLTVISLCYDCDSKYWRN